MRTEYFQNTIFVESSKAFPLLGLCMKSKGKRTTKLHSVKKNCRLGCDAVQAGRISRKFREEVSICCWLGFLFDPEDGNTTSLRGVCELSELLFSGI
jgi:hypothetical protein